MTALQTPETGKAALLAEVVGKLQSMIFSFEDEDQLQARIQGVLADAGLPARREIQLSGGAGRIDLLTGTIGIEVKVAGGASAVIRQLMRYAASPEISALILVTTKASHAHVPPILKGKPVVVVGLWKAGL